MFGVEASTFLTELEVEDVTSIGVLSDGSEGVFGLDGLTFADRDGRETRIDGDVGAVTEHDDVGAAILEDGADSAIEDGTGGTTLLTTDVDALVVEGDVAESCHGVVAVVAHHAVTACDRHRKTTFVACKVVGEFGISTSIVALPCLVFLTFHLLFLSSHLHIGIGSLGISICLLSSLAGSFLLGSSLSSTFGGFSSFSSLTSFLSGCFSFCQFAGFLACLRFGFLSGFLCLALTLCFGTSLSLYLGLDDAVNLGIEGLFLLLVVLYLLLHVEEGDLCLCAFLHALQGFLLLLNRLQVLFFLSLG